MKEYKFIEKKVIIKGKKYDAIFPEKHSTIIAFADETINLNAWDSWSNIERWYTTCLVKYKNSHLWNKIYDGATRNYNINSINVDNKGIDFILYAFEDEKTRKQLEKQSEINECKEKIRFYTKELKMLRKG